jgi:tetratricopeptide (TPR) repeat protein
MLRWLAFLFVLALWPAAAGGQAPAWNDAMAAGETAFAAMDLAEARTHFEAALEAAEGFAPGDPRLGLTLADLGTVLNGLGDYAEAEPLFERALRIWEKSPPESELHRATALHGLAGVHYARGEIEAAEPLLERALEIREKALAAEHPAVLQTRKSIATLKRAKRPQSQAKPAAKTTAKPKAQSAAKPEPAPASPAETAPPPPSTPKPGGYAVHLASLRTVAGAKREWTDLQAAFPALLDGLPLVVEPADLGERGVFHRVLAGAFARRAEARDLCARLEAKDRYCTVVRR